MFEFPWEKSSLAGMAYAGRLLVYYNANQYQKKRIENFRISN